MKKIIKYFLIFVILLLVAFIIIGGGFGERNDYNLIHNGKPLIFAHRGYVNGNVENSSESFLKSDSIGFDAIETDINCTKDGKLIILHDDTCKRLLGINSKVREINWVDINKQPVFYNGKPTKNLLLSLDNFLNQIDSSKVLYLDMKVTSKSIADSLLSILYKHRNIKNIIIADENPLFLFYIKMKTPKMRVALEGFDKGKEFIHYIIPVKFKPDYYASYLSEVDENHVNFLKKHNLLKNKIVYSVKDKNIDDVYRLGIQNIILDYAPSMGSIDEIKQKLLKNSN